jgi:CheY-like chemotaxis protein
MRILCVDDDRLVRHVTGDLLRELGHDVLEAEDGPSALARIHRAGLGIDMLITDIAMPGGMDGVQLVERARLGRPDLAVIYMTGMSHHRIQDAEVLEKPCTMGSLATAIHSADAKRPRSRHDAANTILANSLIGRSGQDPSKRTH